MEKKTPEDHSLCRHPRSISLLGGGSASPVLRMGSRGTLVGQSLRLGDSNSHLVAQFGPLTPLEVSGTL